MGNLYAQSAKRVMDAFVSGILIVLLSPIMLLTALLVRIKLGRPVLFRQTRPGKGGQPFELLKFRTMTNDCDDSGDLLPEEKRLSVFGKRLRSSSLDELPELLNVVRGEMSLVGPRPLLMQYLPLYSPAQARRHEVRPGITGWAQIRGRNSLSWPEKFELDVWYVDNISFQTDMKVIWGTFRTVISGRGVNAPDGGTMPPFTG